MSWKKIMKIWTNRTTKCSVCRRPHCIAHISKIPEKAKKSLKPFPCHLPIHPAMKGHEGYVGSYVLKEGRKEYTVDVYDYPISMKKAYITIERKAKEEKQPEEDLENSMKAYPEDFEGSYIYYDDEDTLAEEEDP